jgi:signal peptidase I
VGFTRALVGQSPGRTLIRGLALGALLLVGSKTIAVPVRASGISMLPTYVDGQLLFFNTLAYRFDDPARGDIVAITYDAEGPAVLIKRVIALPGERVRIENGILYVDDVRVGEPYVHERARWNVDEFPLADDEYLVIGDNRSMALENHTFGIVSREALAGRILF